MSNNNRELSQIASFLEVVEPTKNIYIKSPLGENIGIGTTSPRAKVEVVGNVRVTGILTAQSIVSSSGISTFPNVNVATAITTINLNVTGITTTAGLAVSGITTTQNLTVVGVSTFQNNVYFGDNDSLYFGDGNDLQIYHSATNSYISDVGTGDLYITSSNGSIRVGVSTTESAIVANQDASVDLYFNNSKKFETTSGGVIVTGILTATTLVGNVAYAASTGFSTTSSYATNAGFSTNAVSADYATTAGFATITSYANVSGVSTTVNGTVDVSVLRVSGVSTFTNGPVLIGAATSTGTASQRLQVTGGGYVSGNLGIGTTVSSVQVCINSSGSEQLRIYGNGGGYLLAGYDQTNNRARIGGYTGSAWTTLLLNESGGNVLVNNTSATGTASQPFQVTGGGYFSGNLGVGATNPVARLHVLNGPLLVGSATSSGVATHNLQVYGGAYFSNSSNIGFGTTAPRANVDFQGTVYCNNAVSVGSTLIGGALTVNGGVNYTGGAGVFQVSSGVPSIPSTIYSNLSSGTIQIFAGGLLSSSSRGGQIDFVGGASTDTYPGQLLFRTGIGTNGTSQPITARLDTAGVMYANTFTSTSDERKKENIETIEDAPAILNELRGVRFNWKETGKPSVGVIAQEVEKVLPEAVESDIDGMKSVSYDMLIGILIETVKEQQKRIDALEEKLNGAE